MEDSRDLAQETLLKVSRGYSDFRQEASLPTWIFSIARNTWANFLRHRNAFKRDAPEISLDYLQEEGAAEFSQGLTPSASSENPLALVLEGERRHLLMEHVKNLPERMRRCLILRINQELKYREIAVVLDISIETVKSQLHQARDRLRKELSTS